MNADDPRALRPTTSSRTGSWLPWAIVLLLAAGVGWWLWGPRTAPPAPQVSSNAPAEPAPAPSLPASQATGPQHPIEALPPATATLPALDASDAYVTDALVALLGRGPVANWLQTDRWVQRVVATTDNLTRPQAAARLWPVHPTAPQFQVRTEAGQSSIAPENARRYEAMLTWAESVPMDRLVRVYASLYPLFQSAYEELGYPRGYFNDRLVAVLDHLLQAPEPTGPVRVQLTEVKGGLADPRPWVRYEFADPQWQAMSSGHKLLVRMGPANAQRAKALLRALRQQVASDASLKK